MIVNKNVLLFLLILTGSSAFAQFCDCTEYIYLNDTESRTVHKFKVESDGTLTEVFTNGNTWYPGANPTELPSPHGLGVDLNGFLYISERAVGQIRKLSCDGEIVPASDFEINAGSRNMGTIGNLLITNNGPNVATGIDIYDLCSQDPVGVICFEDYSNNWGLFIDPRTQDIYVSKNVSPRIIYKATLADMNSGTCVMPFLEEGANPEPVVGDNFLSDTFDPYGMTTDEDGNLYVVGTPSFPNSQALIYKYSPTGVLLAKTIVDNDGGDGTIARWSNALSVVYSETTGFIYSSNANQNFTEDCISIFDTNLNYIGTGFPNPPSGSGQQAKGIGINTECCPTSSNMTLDTTLCAASMGDQLFLQELINCTGIICEGLWIEEAGNSGFTYDPCDNSITLDATDACGSFTIASDGSASAAQCGPFSITLNVEAVSNILPTITGIQPTCSGNNDPAPITASGGSASGTVSYQWLMSTSDCNSGFSEISGETMDSYDPPVLTVETHYRLVTLINGSCSSGACTDTTACVTLIPETDCCPSPNCFGITVTRN